MKIAALRFYNVKRFARQGVAIENIADGVNVLCAANEYGKSTSFEALHALFFQPHTGAPKEVKRLQPYSGGNPLVEADIVVPEGRFRLSKQFLGGRRATVESLDDGRLIAQADEAERFIAGLVRGGTAGPAGLLWVRQGITGIGDRARKEEDEERQVRESLLSSVQGEVEAVTGGRRMSQIMAACQDELAVLVTPTGRPKADGPYSKALDLRNTLAETEKRLAGEVAILREALDRRARLQRELAELSDPDEQAARREAVVKARAALDHAKSHAERLTAAQAQAGLARNQAEAAERALVAFREALHRSATVRVALDAAAAQRGQALTRRAEAARAIDEALAEVRAAEAGEAAARALMARLDAALAARRAAAEIEALRARLAAADAKRGEVEAAEAALALIALPAGAVDALQKLETEIATLRAAREAGLPSVLLDYEPGIATPVLIDGEPLPAGEPRPVADRARLTIAGLGTLTLRSNRPEADDGRLETAQTRRLRALSAVGAADLADARRREAQAREASAALDLLRLELRHLAPEGLATLREEVARRAALAPEPTELSDDPEEARRAREAADRRVQAARNAAREVEPLHRHAGEAVTAAETAYLTLKAEFERLEAGLGPENERPAQEARLASAHENLAATLRERDAAAAQLLDGAPDLQSAEAVLRRATSAEDAARQQQERLQLDLAGLNAEIRTRSDDAVEEAWREASEALEAASKRVAAFEAEVGLLNRLAGTLADARAAARDLYLQPVIGELRPLLGMLFDDVSIVFDEKTLLPQTIRRNGQDEEIDRLSGGMREQLSVLTRLAFARLLAQGGRPAPVILDDALVYSDDDRIERMFEALHRQAMDQQIIVFSCRQRAFARLGGQVLRMEPWQPAT
ncbi:DNA-binding protein [Ancylobacter sp. A5.8]|uniref:AAA family ATPase n=1 Tax=Ancylobacter gelatini TaxID=2919920 RepID=UPI001F4DEE45|nr:DNA-binding protein [Ancylobacter gelatini]MCJ8142210.1 DNA-binding protein [Ancylobacter gelatini]